MIDTSLNHHTAVALATYFPSRRSVRLFIEMLNYLEEHFADCDLFVGVNPSEYAPIGIDLLKKSKLKFRCLEVNTELDTRSDASAFQAALLLMKQSNTNYDVVYFMHLKGASLLTEYTATNPSGNKVEFNVLRAALEVFKNRSYIEGVFESDTRVGTFSHLLGKSRLQVPDVTSDLMEFRYPPFYTYLHFYTFYAVRGSAVSNILSSAKPIFWSSNLAKISDIYFFERDFTQMVWRQGLLPKCNVFTKLNDGMDVNEQIFQEDSFDYLKVN